MAFLCLILICIHVCSFLFLTPWFDIPYLAEAGAHHESHAEGLGQATRQPGEPWPAMVSQQQCLRFGSTRKSTPHNWPTLSRMAGNGWGKSALLWQVTNAGCSQSFSLRCKAMDRQDYGRFVERLEPGKPRWTRQWLAWQLRGKRRLRNQASKNISLHLATYVVRWSQWPVFWKIICANSLFVVFCWHVAHGCLKNRSFQRCQKQMSDFWGGRECQIYTYI